MVAAIERGQLRVLEARAQWAPEARRHKFDYDQETLGHLPGIGFRAQWAPAPGREAVWGRHTRWLTCMIVDPLEFGATREDLRLALEAENIEARPRPGAGAPWAREADASREPPGRGLCRV